MTFEERKQKVLQTLEELDTDVKILQKRIMDAKQTVKGFINDEEAKKWCEDFDFEADLVHIFIRF